MNVQNVKKGLHLLLIMHAEYAKFSSVLGEFSKEFAEAHSDMLGLFTEELGIPTGVGESMKGLSALKSSLASNFSGVYEDELKEGELLSTDETETLDLSQARYQAAERDMQSFDKSLLGDMIVVALTAKLYMLKHKIVNLTTPNGDVPPTSIASVYGDAAKELKKMSIIEGDGLPTASGNTVLLTALMDIASGLVNLCQEKKLPFIENLSPSYIVGVVGRGMRALKYHACSNDMIVK